MAKFRTSGTALAKTLEQSSCLIYLVGKDGAIRYANPACAAWVQMDIEEMFGRSLAYTSELSTSDVENRLNGLAPPPDAFVESSDFANVKTFLLISPPETKVGKIQSRWASACLIADDDHGDEAVLVISQPTNLAERPNFASDTTTASELHSLLCEIRQQHRSIYRVDSLVGVSAFAKRLRYQAEIAISSQFPVYIFGPEGSGREHLARTIHAQSGSQSAPLITMQGAAADRNQIREILAGALKKKTAPSTPWADGGTLPTDATVSVLLLEADQMSMEAQQELFGSLNSSKAPIRVLATGRCDLVERGSTQKFHSELASLLATIKIELVSIAQRLEDIPLLAQALLERPSRKYSVAGFDGAALQKLGEYRWPGNLDQLSWVVDQAGENVRDRLLGVSDLPEKFHHWLRAQQFASSAEVTIHLDQYLESIERELILRAIGQAKGNKSQAAKLLSLSRAKLLRRIEHLNLEAELNRRSIGDAEQNARTISREKLSSRTQDLVEGEAAVKAEIPRPSRLRAKLLSRPIPEEIEDEKNPENFGGDDWLSPDAFEEVD